MKIWLLLIGMTLVTYLPRWLPGELVGKLKFGKKTEKFLKLIPYTAMASLIFPGILSSDPDRWYMGVIGGVTAGILGFKKAPVMVCVLGAIAVNFLIYCFI